MPIQTVIGACLLILDFLVITAITPITMHTIASLVWQVTSVCSVKAEFSFLQRKTAFWCSFKRVPNRLSVLSNELIKEEIH